MNPPNDVRNVLEEKLLAAQEGHISSDELLEVLLVSPWLKWYMNK